MRIECDSECSSARHTIGTRVDHDHIARRAPQLLEKLLPPVGRGEDVPARRSQYDPKVRLEWGRQISENVEADSAHVSGKCTFLAENAPFCPVWYRYLGLASGSTAFSSIRQPAAEARMTKRSITFAILTVLTAAVAACSSATAPAQDCQPGVSAGSGTCH